MTRTGLTLRLGWLGTGRMGSALALRLLAAGCDLTVYNRTNAKAEPLAARGAVIAETAADLGTADIVFVTVGSSDDLIEAILGPHGLIEGPSAPAIVVDCSTVSTEASQQIRERLAACGTALLAAPVMGNAKVALAGGSPWRCPARRRRSSTHAPTLTCSGPGQPTSARGRPPGS